MERPNVNVDLDTRYGEATASLQMPFSWKRETSASWIYQKASSKPLSLKGIFSRMSICRMIQWNFPEYQWLEYHRWNTFTCTWNHIYVYIYIFSPAERISSQHWPTRPPFATRQQRPWTTTSSLSGRHTSCPTAVKPFFNGTYQFFNVLDSVDSGIVPRELQITNNPIKIFALKSEARGAALSAFVDAESHTFLKQPGFFHCWLER